MNFCCPGHVKVSSLLQSSADVRRLDLFRTDVVCPPKTLYTKPSAQIRKYGAERVFELLHYHDQELTLDHPVEILKHY
jgi:hypothetical protein